MLHNNINSKLKISKKTRTPISKTFGREMTGAALTANIIEQLNIAASSLLLYTLRSISNFSVSILLSYHKKISKMVLNYVEKLFTF